MSGSLQSIIKKYIRITVIILISFAAVFLLSAVGVIKYWDTALYNLCIKYRVLSGQKSRSPVIASIDLNDKSINELKDDVDTRKAFSVLLDVLTRANASVVFDFLFTADKSGDADFINSVENSWDTVIAALAIEKSIMNQPNSPYEELSDDQWYLLNSHLWKIRVLEKGKVPQAGTFLLPQSGLIKAAAQIAHINMEPDNDGIYRRVPLLYEWSGGYIPSLGLAAAVRYLGVNIRSIELYAGKHLSLPVSQTEIIKIPIDEYGCMLIPYTQTWADDDYRVSFSEVVEANEDMDIFFDILNDLSGSIALAAEISTAQKDYGPVPFERFYPLSGIHGEILGSILEGYERLSFIWMVSLPFKLVTILLIVIIAFLFSKLKKELFFHLGYLSCLLAFSALTFFNWKYFATAPWFAFPITLVFFLWLCEFLLRMFYRFKEQLLLQNALSRYFPHALAQRIIKEKKTELVPAYKELTILFSDISGFTKWSSDKGPEDVHEFLSDYLESMAEIIFSHGGTVDKFMGDGILAFFGDPFSLPDHCEQCIKAAIAMQKKVKQLAKKWKPLVDIDLKVRVGINIGKVIVGNLGNKTRIEYTVIGAAVNLAQRMESNAPVGGILVTANVRRRAGDKFAFPERKDVVVKGYAEKIEAYVVGME